MRDLYVDGRLVDLASYVWNNGTVEGCAAKAKFCQSSPCQNSGLTAFQLYEFIVNILKVIWLLHELISVNPIVFVLKFNVDASLSQYREKSILSLLITSPAFI